MRAGVSNSLTSSEVEIIVLRLSSLAALLYVIFHLLARH
jgi:hypothetical protein